MVASYRIGACAATVALAAVLGAQPAGSADDALRAGDVPVVWHCWYESTGVYRIRCVPAAADSQPDATVRSGRFVDIPIYVPPYSGVERSERLAKAVMCARNAACRITFDHGQARPSAPH